MNLIEQRVGVTVKAVRYPACFCGSAYAQHIAPGCAGYRPTAPVEDLGTRGYTPRLTLSLWRCILCIGIWAIERRLQGWRERVDRG